VLTENSDYESRKLKINQGSMPNLNDINTVHGAIEHNRYYRQNSAPDNQNVSIESHADFRETEFCAQSSQLNIDPESPEKRSRPSSPIMSKHLLHVQFSDNVRSKQVQSPLHLSPTMKRIQEDPEFKPISPKKSVFQMTFSPPRKSMSAETLRRETFVVPRQGRQIRATTWKQQQNKEIFKVPKELKLTSSAAPRLSTQSLHSISNSSISSTASMPSNLTSGRLYNENILMPNNDPFSATTTQDPFLSSTMYLNDKKLDSIEKAYIKWLNALVTIPADLESDKNEKIDVGKLFSDVQCKELSIAQTKEVVASKYYTSRLDSLRSAAIRLIQSQEITSVLTKITVAVNSDKDPLGVKNERPIHLDLVLQRSLLELLLCYNPLWLRISLEVVFNVQLNLTSNHDILGMTRFIVSRMFKDQYILDKMGRLPSRRNEMLLQLRRHTVKHLLFILYFLDRAKENRLIKQNPCLFVRRAPYKESNDILKKLASLVLSNYGDVMRHMKRYDFVLTHKQTVIDEFDYAFKNLAIDLRDGVRLTKVMEIILMRDDLVNKVRVPGKFERKEKPVD
jgi:abnormal spindle-like microcephaly-associated protein